MRSTDPARERILTTAYELFSRRGIRDVGIGEVVERASIAKATLYRHFPSKTDLVLAFLDRREQVWTKQTLEGGARCRGATAEHQLPNGSFVSAAAGDTTPPARRKSSRAC